MESTNICQLLCRESVCHQEIAKAEEKLKESDVSSSLRAYAEHTIYYNYNDMKLN